MARCRSTREFECWAKCRQAYFRDTSPTITERCRPPTDNKDNHNLYILPPGCEEENLFPGIRGPGGAIDFFKDRGIEWWGSGVGPTGNMTSSQVACVNFLLPLKDIPGALLCMLRAIDDDVCDIITIRYGVKGHESPVEFEWIGLDRSLEGGKSRGAHNTSIDAFLIAETKAGRRRAYLLEWKYVEQYLSTRPDFKGKGKSGDTRRRRYAEPFSAPYSSFDPDAAPNLDDFLYEPFYQIMRQRLLADLMVFARDLGIDEAKLVVVVPECNWAYRTVACYDKTTSPPLAERFPQLKTVEEIMRAVLKDPDKQFAMVAPVLLLKAVSRCLPDQTGEWAGYWRERYGV